MVYYRPGHRIRHQLGSDGNDAMYVLLELLVWLIHVARSEYDPATVTR